MPTKRAIKTKKKEPVTTVSAVEQLNLAVAYAQDGSADSALRCAKNACRTLEKLAAHQKKMRVQLSKKSKK